MGDSILLSPYSVPGTAKAILLHLLWPRTLRGRHYYPNLQRKKLKFRLSSKLCSPPKGALLESGQDPNYGSPCTFYSPQWAVQGISVNSTQSGDGRSGPAAHLSSCPPPLLIWPCIPPTSPLWTCPRLCISIKYRPSRISIQVSLCTDSLVSFCLTQLVAPPQEHDHPGIHNPLPHCLTGPTPSCPHSLIVQLNLQGISPQPPLCMHTHAHLSSTLLSFSHFTVLSYQNPKSGQIQLSILFLLHLIKK